VERQLELLLAREASDEKTEEAADVSHMCNRTRPPGHQNMARRPLP